MRSKYTIALNQLIEEFQLESLVMPKDPKEILISSDISKLLSGADAIPRDDLTGTLVRYSIAMVGTLPILVAYPFAQKFFVKGVTLGGVKG